MNRPKWKSIRVRLALWYVGMLSAILVLYVAALIAFQYAQLQRQMYHDEVQDVETVEGLFTFNGEGKLELQQGYFARPRNKKLVDRFLEVLSPAGTVIYRSSTLNGQALGDAPYPGEGEESFNERSFRLADGTRVFMVSHLHPLQGRPILIRLGYSLSPLTKRLSQLLVVLVLALPVAILAAAFAAYFVAQRALRPLDLMALRAETITANNLSERLTIVDENDELGHMGRVLNQLLERLERAFSEMRRFTADVSHELRTPLAALQGTGELALVATEDAHVKEMISFMLEEVMRLNQTIDNLLLLSKTESQQIGDLIELISLPSLVQDILDLLEVMFEEKQIEVTQRLEENSRHEVYAERTFVRMALLNVLHNATKFSPAGETIVISFTSVTVDGIACQRVCVRDSGPGIAPGEHEKVLERFFTSRNPGTAKQSGTGLGLSIAKLAVERSGGRLYFDRTTTIGALCCISLPALSPAQQ